MSDVEDLDLTAGPTIADLARCPLVMDLVEAASYWGLGRSKAYELARVGQLPFKTIRLARKRAVYRVRLADLAESLGVDPQTLLAARASQSGADPGAGRLSGREVTVGAA